MKFPWEENRGAAPDVDKLVDALRRDLAYVVTHTAVAVHSPHAALQMLVNVPRGQIIPRGVCNLTDGSTIEFQDIGAPQVGAPEMNIEKLMMQVFDAVQELGLGVT